MAEGPPEREARREPPPSLHAYALPFAEGIPSGRIVVPGTMAMSMADTPEPEPRLERFREYATVCGFAAKSGGERGAHCGCIDVCEGAQGAIPHETRPPSPASSAFAWRAPRGRW